MKKRLFYILIMVVSLLFLTACGEGEEAAPSGDAPTGHNMIHCDAKEATCETRGHTAYEDCIDFACDYREGYEVIQPLGHDLIDVPEKAATLTEKGHTAYKKCSRCDYREGYSETDFSCSEHSFEVTPKKAPTCLESGISELKTCTICKYKTGGEVIPLLGHDWATIPAKAATPDGNGYTEHKKCSRCGSIEGKTEIAFVCTDHKFITVPEKAPTEKENGHNSYQKCSICGHSVGYKITRVGYPCMVYLPSIEERLSIFNLSEKDRKNLAGMYRAAINFEPYYKFEGTVTTRDLIFYYKIMQNSFCDAMMLYNQYNYTMLGSAIESINFVYTMSKEEYTAKMEAIEEKLLEVLSAVEGMTDEEKAMYIHDYVIKSAHYNTKAENRMNAYGALVEGKALCDGLADAYALLCGAAGLKCGIVLGTTSELHAWNIVQIDGKYTYLDITRANEDHDKLNQIHHYTFGLGDARMKALGYKTDSDYAKIIPAAVDIPNKGEKNKTNIHSGENVATRIDEIIKLATSRGDTDLFIYCDSQSLYDQAAKLVDELIPNYLKAHYRDYSYSSAKNAGYYYIYYKISYSNPK